MLRSDFRKSRRDVANRKGVGRGNKLASDFPYQLTAATVTGRPVGRQAGVASTLLAPCPRVQAGREKRKRADSHTCWHRDRKGRARGWRVSGYLDTETAPEDAHDRPQILRVSLDESRDW